MRALFSNLLTASVSGSIVILAVLVLLLVLRKTPKKFICILWMVAGLRLLLPVPLQSRFSLQPPTIRLPQSETLQTYLVPLWCIVAVSLLCASLISYAHLRRQVKDARKILFPEGESCIDAQQIRFRSAWADSSGTTYQGTDTYRFDETGNLTRVDRLVQDGIGTVLSHDYLEVLSQDYGVCVNYIADCASLDYADSFSTGADSPWNIFLRVDDDLLLPTGGEIMVSWQGVGRGSYTMDDRYWLEKKASDGWQRLQGDNTYPFGTVLQPLSSMSQIFSLDWSSTYGALDSGVYRLGTRFYSGSESIIQYAQFAIGPTGGIHGAGAEEAMARVDAVIDQLKTASYHVKKTEGYPEHGELVQSEEILQYGGDLAVAIYKEGTYSHCFVESGDDRLWDGWYNYSYYPGPYDSFYFPEGQSVISDNEITFLYSSSQASEDNPLTRCTYRFDKQGNITEIERESFGWGAYVVRYTFLDTPESEIQQTVADMKENDYNLFLS